MLISEVRSDTLNLAPVIPTTVGLVMLEARCIFSLLPKGYRGLYEKNMGLVSESVPGVKYRLRF